MSYIAERFFACYACRRWVPRSSILNIALIASQVVGIGHLRLQRSCRWASPVSYLFFPCKYCVRIPQPHPSSGATVLSDEQVPNRSSAWPHDAGTGPFNLVIRVQTPCCRAPTKSPEWTINHGKCCWPSRMCKKLTGCFQARPAPGMYQMCWKYSWHNLQAMAYVHTHNTDMWFLFK